MSSVCIGTVTFDWYPIDPLVRLLAEAAKEAGNKLGFICLRQPGEKRQE